MDSQLHIEQAHAIGLCKVYQHLAQNGIWKHVTLTLKEQNCLHMPNK